MGFYSGFKGLSGALHGQGRLYFVKPTVVINLLISTGQAKLYSTFFH